MLILLWALFLFLAVIALILYSSLTMDIDEYTDKFIGRRTRRDRAES